jgi:hypothetical protein
MFTRSSPAEPQSLQPANANGNAIGHMSLAIERGAEFDGRCQWAADASALGANLSV